MALTDEISGRSSIEEMLHALHAMDLAGKSHALQERLLSLQKKLASGQLHLAVLGQMKRGKSSLINALLNADVLPTGILPATAIITEIRYGVFPGATVVYQAGGLRETVPLSDLAAYITEAGNPGNRKQVASVEIVYPSTFLENGLILIDTPGIGSTHSHNTETTEHYLAEVDAGIVVLSTDPPITEVESKFIQELKDEIPKLLFVLNKTDTTSTADVSEIVHFLENELDRQGIFSPEIFPLSALRDRTHPMEQGSGLQRFEARLRMFLSQEKREVLVRSVAMDVLEIANLLRFATSMGARANILNAEELCGKRAALAQLIDQTDVDIHDLQLLLRQRSSDLMANVEHDLAVQVRESVENVQEHVVIFRSRHPQQSGRALGSSLEEFLMHEVESVFTRWRIREDEKVQSELTAFSNRFTAQANSILTRLEECAGSLFEVPVEHLTVRCPLRVESHLNFRVERIFHSLDSSLLLLPRFMLRPIVFRRALRNVPLLLDMNAGRIRYDYLERLQASVTRFEKDLFSALEMVTTSLKSVINGDLNRDQDQLTVTLNTLDSIRSDCKLLVH